MSQEGGSPSIVVKEGDTLSEGCKLQLPRCWMVFFTLICCKICVACLKRPKINEKEAMDGPFFKKVLRYISSMSLNGLGPRADVINKYSILK